MSTDVTTTTTTPPPAPRRRFAGLVAHLGWEALLFLPTVVITIVAITQVSSGRTAFLWLAVATLGVLASAFSFSLRTATPNLAVAAQAMLAGAIYAVLSREDWPGVAAALVAVVAVTVLGVIMGTVAGLTSAPGWAVSLGGLAVAQAVAMALIDVRGVLIAGGGRPGTGTAVLWMLLFALGSLAGGVLFAVPAVRRFLGANRTSEDPAIFRVKRLIGSLAGFTGSSLLAAVSGLMWVTYLSIAFTHTDTSRLLYAVGAVLLGGVSVFGRRGGFAGTLLAVTLLVMWPTAFQTAQSSSWIAFGLPATAIGVGLAASWALEKIGGREPVS